MSKRLVFSHNPLLSGPALGDRQSTTLPYREIPLEEIDRDPNQPRVSFDDERLGELAESIKLYGVLQPITVRPLANGDKKYVVVFGERRFRASEKIGLKTIPAIVDGSSDQEDGARTLAIQLVENIQRDELTSLERAHAISTLKEAYELSIREVAEKIGISKSVVQRSIAILDLPDDLLNALRQGVPESKVLILAKEPDKVKRAQLLSSIDKLSREDLQKRIQVKTLKPKKPVAGKAKDPDDMRIEEELQRAIGLKTKLQRNPKDPEAGRLTIELHCEQDLQLIFRKLVGEAA